MGEGSTARGSRLRSAVGCAACRSGRQSLGQVAFGRDGRQHPLRSPSQARQPLDLTAGVDVALIARRAADSG